MDNKYTYGIFISLMVLIGGGVGVYILTPDQLDKSSTCTSNNVTTMFERLSGTNITGYWTNSDGSQNQSQCKKGTWIPTREWMKINNVSEKDIIIQPVIESDEESEGIKLYNGESSVVVDKDMKIMTGDTIINITYKPSIKCIPKNYYTLNDCLTS